MVQFEHRAGEARIKPEYVLSRKKKVLPYSMSLTKSFLNFRSSGLERSVGSTTIDNNKLKRTL